MLSAAQKTIACDHSVCRLCRFANTDIRLSCGCSIHARCIPLSLVLASSNGQLVPVEKSSPRTCPICQSAPVSEIILLPLSLDCINQAVLSRKTSLKGKEGSLDVVQTDSSYLLLTHSSAANSMAGDYPFMRTGRWSEEERVFVDFLMNAFDNGILPIPEGIRLNDFLSDLLLCKNSRLTKKMKNAKLSARSYKFNPGQKVGLDIGMMSTLEGRFLESVTSVASRFELRFNMMRAWRTHFSNMCLQAGSEILNATEWVANIEFLEQRAAQTEEAIRKSRRQRMGLALRTDVKAANEASTESTKGVFISGLSVGNLGAANPKPGMVRSDSLTPTVVSGDDVSKVDEPVAERVSSSSETSSADNLQDGEDFSAILNEFLLDPPAELNTSHQHLRNNSGPFLEEIAGFMETANLPFEHVDIWVPSYAPRGSMMQDELRLCHAGHASRNDIDSSLYCHLFEYGEYSSKFSFTPGVGLPGRVFASNRHSWERSCDEADSKYFERAGGAKVYGVKTAFGLPLKTSVIGKVILVMYSAVDLVEDPAVVANCLSTFAEFVPEPKWKLVVEMGSSTNTLPTSSVSVEPAMRQPDHLPTLTSFNYGNRDRSPSVASASSHATAASCHSDLRSAYSGQNQSISASHGGNSNGRHSPAESITPLSEDQIIVNLLGKHMPMAGLSTSEDSSSPIPAPDNLLQHFMAVRLAFIRDHRTAADNEMLDTIRKSYRGYASDTTKRSERELAMLIVRDWQFLSLGNTGKKAPATPAKPQSGNSHVCHVMNPPKMSTFASTGHPVTVPTELGLPSLGRRSPTGESEEVPLKKRKYSEDSFADVDLNLIDNF